MIFNLELELADETAEALVAHLASLQRPARVDPATHSVVIEPRYAPGMELEQWTGEVLAMNIAGTLRDNPTPTMLEHRKAMQEAEQRLQQAIAPTVRAKKPA